MRDVVVPLFAAAALIVGVSCSEAIAPPTTGAATLEVTANGSPVSGAIVAFGNLHPDTTDGMGQVRYDEVPPGEYEAVLSRLPVDFTLGQESHVKTLTVGAGETRTLTWDAEVADPAVVVGALNISFSPRTATIRAGESVRFEFRSGSRHTVTPEEEFGHWVDRPLVTPADDFTVTFNAPGVYRYLCEPHASGFGEDEGPMNGVIIVEQAGAGE